MKYISYTCKGGTGDDDLKVSILKHLNTPFSSCFTNLNIFVNGSNGRDTFHPCSGSSIPGENRLLSLLLLLVFRDT